MAAISHIDNPREFRLFDHELFDWLQETIRQHPERRTARIEATQMLAGAVYFAEPLAYGNAHRKA